MTEATYAYYREALRGRCMPLAFVDLDRFDANADAVLARAGVKPVCVASKSIRCVPLLNRLFARSPRFRAAMAFSLREAVFLARNGIDRRILVAYPAWGELEHADLANALRVGAQISLMVDCADHVDRLEQFGAKNGVRVSACIDVDMASVYPGLYFGVRRSSVRTPEQALALLERSRAGAHVAIEGLMGYEAQVAGLADRVPGERIRGAVLRFLKRRSIATAAARRTAIACALAKAGCALAFVNGGGTGSIESTAADASVTEVTAGSAFFAPASFDHFSGFKHLPAAGYAIEITRSPAPGIFTCQAGGYVASGSSGLGQWPRPYLPEGARLLAQEGAGEVQTPIAYDGPERLAIGDPIFMRHAKAGELCERFDRLFLISSGTVVDEAATYRGEGQCFG